MAGSSIFMQAMEGVQTAIQNLNMTGIPDNRVLIRRKPHDGSQFYEGITVHPSEEKYDQGTNMREGVGYGCAVTMIVNNDSDSLYLLDRLLLWRETIRRYFVENDSLATVTGGVSYTVKVEHGKVLDWDMLDHKNLDASALVIRVYVLETRT